MPLTQTCIGKFNKELKAKTRNTYSSKFNGSNIGGSFETINVSYGALYDCKSCSLPSSAKYNIHNSYKI